MDQGWAYSSTFSRESPETSRTPVAVNNERAWIRRKACFKRRPTSEPFEGLLEEIGGSKSELILVTFLWHFCDIFVTFCDILTTFDDFLDCLIAFLLACLPACLLACLLACFSACLLARSLACFLACFPACLLAFLRETEKQIYTLIIHSRSLTQVAHTGSLRESIYWHPHGPGLGI